MFMAASTRRSATYTVSSMLESENILKWYIITPTCAFSDLVAIIYGDIVTSDLHA